MSEEKAVDKLNHGKTKNSLMGFATVVSIFVVVFFVCVGGIINLQLFIRQCFLHFAIKFLIARSSNK